MSARVLDLGDPTSDLSKVALDAKRKAKQLKDRELGENNDGSEENDNISGGMKNGNRRARRRKD